MTDFAIGLLAILVTSLIIAAAAVGLIVLRPGRRRRQRQRRHVHLKIDLCGPESVEPAEKKSA